MIALPAFTDKPKTDSDMGTNVGYHVSRAVNMPPGKEFYRGS